MYAAPSGAVAAFRDGLRRHLECEGLHDLPPQLDEPADLCAHWLDPHLLLSQTCGYPLTTSLAGRVRYVGTPCYGAPGCDGPFYSSAVVVRADDPALAIADLRGRRAAFNSTDSQSGYNAFRALVAPHARAGAFFSAVTETGSHRASLRAVAEGSADVAAVDAVTLALLRRDQPAEAAEVRLLCYTARAPGLPLITAATTSDAAVAALRRGITAACRDPALADSRAALLLSGFEVLPAGAYDAIASMRADAMARGYPALA